MVNNHKSIIDKEKYKKVKLRLRWEGVVYFFLLGILAIALGVALIFLKDLKTVIVGSIFVILGIIMFSKILLFNIFDAYWLRLKEDSIQYKSFFSFSNIQQKEIVEIRQKIIPNTTTNKVEITYFQNSKKKKIAFVQALLPKHMEQSIISLLYTHYFKSDVNIQN